MSSGVIFSAKLKEVFWHQTAGEVSEPLLSHLSEKLPDVHNTDDSCLYYFNTHSVAVLYNTGAIYDQ